MGTVIVLFTRDLRVHDNPALHLACAAADRVVPLFALDPALATPPNRRRFLAQSLADLRGALRGRGGDLVIRHGDPVDAAMTMAREVSAEGIVLAADASAYAARRERRLRRAGREQRLWVKLCDAAPVVPPGALRPSGGGDHYRVFTPYWRAWLAVPRRAERPAPRAVALPAGIAPGELPAAGAGESAAAAPGGEQQARRRLAAWRAGAGDYASGHDALDRDVTSHLSPYLHFGCVSAVTVANRAAAAAEFLRQLCWRDFYLQVLHAFPELPHRAYRPGAVEEWVDDPPALAAWCAGRTGIPIVDAGMRQLAAEGFLPNRARLITASFLTRHLRLDWRAGASWYSRLLVDADVANNFGNWQWVAGTGNDTRPHRRFNPLRQARRFDPDGSYVRRWVPELRRIPGPAVHEPWLRPAADRPGYGGPLAPLAGAR